MPGWGCETEKSCLCQSTVLYWQTVSCSPLTGWGLERSDSRSVPKANFYLALRKCPGDQLTRWVYPGQWCDSNIYHPGSLFVSILPQALWRCYVAEKPEGCPATWKMYVLTGDYIPTMNSENDSPNLRNKVKTALLLQLLKRKIQ